MLRGVILDVDGTLVDSNDAHARAWVDALADFGWEAPFFRIRWLIGMGGSKFLPTLYPSLSDDEGIGKVISRRRSNIFLERYLPHLDPTPGTRQLVERMREDGLHLVVATSSKRKELDALLQCAGVADLLQEATTASDVDEPKPAPDVMHAALDKLQLAPDQVAMIADTPYDIQSAERAGVGMIAVRSGGWDDDVLEGAIAIYDDPADILAHYHQTPMAGGNR